MSKKTNTKRKATKRRNNRTFKTVRQPIAKSVQATNRGVMRTLNIKHREYVRDIFETGSTSNIVVPVNPGLIATFPWLSGVSTRFESYKFNKLAFHFITSVATTTDGSICLVPDYDALDNNLEVSKSKLMTYEDAKRSPVWESFAMHCTKRNLGKMKQYFIRDADITGVYDLKTYDVANLIIIGTGTPLNKVLGELWVEYDITLYTPQMSIPEVPFVSQAANITYQDQNQPFTEWDTIPKKGTLASKVVKETDQRLGYKGAAPALLSLISQIIPDSEYEEPAMNIINTGDNLRSTLLSASADWDPTGVIWTGMQQFLLDPNLSGEESGPTQGLDIGFTGYSGLLEDPIAAVQQFAITEISKGVYNAIKGGLLSNPLPAQQLIRAPKRQLRLERWDSRNHSKVINALVSKKYKVKKLTE